MTDNITLPRAAALQIREALMVAATPIPADRHTVKAALAALDAALAEPPATPEPATMQQIVATHRTTYGAPWLDEFDRAWKAAERFHGIKKEDKT
jgi:hypothetical protein